MLTKSDLQRQFIAAPSVQMESIRTSIYSRKSIYGFNGVWYFYDYGVGERIGVGDDYERLASYYDTNLNFRNRIAPGCYFRPEILRFDLNMDVKPSLSSLLEMGAHCSFNIHNRIYYRSALRLNPYARGLFCISGNLPEVILYQNNEFHVNLMLENARFEKERFDMFAVLTGDFLRPAQ